jgi:3-hydroxy-9,10-secoandrosta-1,3,5(10)-triene-9,17-dione monooxygenase
MHESIKAIHDSAAVLREEHPKCDELGHLTDRTVEVLKRSGGMRLLLSKDVGGFAERPAVFAEWVRTVARYNPSAGWVAGVGGVHPWEISVADPRVRKEVYGTDPDTITASPYAPAGRVRPVDGGVRFSTEVVYSTGCDVSDWFILAGMVVDGDGPPAGPPQVTHVILPREEVEIVPDSWNVMGLQGTGSKRVRVHDVFVPEYRTMDQGRLMVGGYSDRQPGEPLFRFPFVAVFGPAIAHALCGIFRGFIDEFTTYLADRKPTFGAEARHDPHQQRALVHAESELEATVAHLDGLWDQMWDKAAAGEPITVQDRVRLATHQKVGASRVLRATEDLWRHAGSATRWTDNPLERYHRDMQVGGSHFGCDPTTMYEPFTTLLFDPSAEVVGLF